MPNNTSELPDYLDIIPVTCRQCQSEYTVWIIYNTSRFHFVCVRCNMRNTYVRVDIQHNQVN